MIGLVLQGGGARGSYHVGAVEALRKRGVKFDVVVGTSIGAINGALIASDDIDKLKRLWLSLNSETVFNISNNYSLKLPNFEDIKDLNKYIESSKIDLENFKNLLNININESKLRKSKIDFGLTTYNMTDKKTIEIFKKDIPSGKLVEYLLASAYLPVFKKEKIIDDKYYFDGGLFNNCPLSMLDEKKYERIYVIKIYENDPIDRKLKKSNVELIIPKRNLGSQILFDKKRTKENMKIGYYDTLKVLDNLDGKNYYIKYRDEKYYKSLFDEKVKRNILFELKLYKNANEKKIILKILESLAEIYKLNKYKVYTVKSLITILKLNMINNKTHKYYKFIKNIKIQ